MIPSRYRRFGTGIPRRADSFQRIDSTARRDSGSLAASAAGREAGINPDDVDYDAAETAARETQEQAERDLTAARDGGDLVAIGNAMRRIAEAIFYRLGLSARIPLAYREAYEKAAKRQAMTDDPQYAEYLRMKSNYEGSPTHGTVPKPQD